MLPSLLARQVRTSVEDLLQAAFAFSTPAFRGVLDDFIAAPENLVKGPWLTLDMPFRRAEQPGEPFPEIPLGFRAYRHQERAFERLSAERPKPSLIATGTGSGKTECFLLPILDACRKAKGEPGVKAILIYPMNALAADQARRIAKLVHKHPGLAGVRAGIYADQKPASPTTQMGETEIITSREEIIRNPPDILLTNYKMLDYMLVRPQERDLWAKNNPETLRYLVVDELHSFDGAQGSDLACLIRRLKARLGMARGSLCCVGTSATLGGGDGLKDLIEYAGAIFDEPFDEAAVVVEDRESVRDYLGERAVDFLQVPGEEDALAIEAAVETEEPDALIRRLAQAWFAEEAADVHDPTWRVGLGERLDGHLFFQTLLRTLDGKPASYAEVSAALRERPMFRSLSDAHLAALLDGMAALIAHARRVDAPGAPPRPFFNVRQQVWVREMRRMVALVEETPTLRHHADLRRDEQERALPVIHCRSCGGAGWATIVPHDQRSGLRASPEQVYEGWFGYSDRLRFILREVPAARTKRDAQRTREAWLWPQGLHLEEGKEPTPRDGQTPIKVVIHQPGRLTSEKFRVDHDCPFCGAANGMNILGARVATLVTGMIATLFSSPYNDDPKLLTFSDSVQDAAHRASIFEARNFSRVLRGGLTRFVCEAVEPPGLDQVIREAPAAMRRGGGEAAEWDDSAFVATYTPADLEADRDYDKLLATGRLPENPRLPEVIEKRLAWEAFAELTFRSHIGQTLEKSGLVAPHLAGDALERVVGDLSDRLMSEANLDPSRLEPKALARFVAGLADHMRRRGAVLDDVTRGYVAREGNWFGTMKSNRVRGKLYLPTYSRSAPQPVFPSNRTLDRFENVYTAALINWYAGWADKFFLAPLVLAGDYHEGLYACVFNALIRAGVAEKLAIGERTAASPAWGLRPEAIRAFADVRRLRCGACGTRRSVPSAFSDLWIGTPCHRLGCRGAMEPDDIRGSALQARLLRAGRIRRVKAREHTSLLDRDARQKIEEQFMDEQPKAWFPNLLSATPTLEMGINIGDLSTLVLCSVPPEQANYVQRIGRTGRRDGNSLNITLAAARPHDLWFWTEPDDMIRGTVKTPGVHLRAVAILKRQLAAFTLDRWVAERGESGRGFGTVGDALRNRANAFPTPWIDWMQERAETLAVDFLKLFPELVRDDPQAAEQLVSFAVGGPQDGLGYAVAQELSFAETELRSLDERLNANSRIQNDLKKQSPPPKDLDERLRDLSQDRKALLRLRRSLREKDLLGFMTDHGLLPNYAFPEEGVKLKSVIYRADGSDEEPISYEYVRPAAAAIGEFAPSTAFYAEGRRVQIDQIDLASSPIEYWRVCPDCTHLELAPDETTDRPCPGCGSSMWMDRGSRRPMVRLRQVVATEEDSRSRIGEGEDEREHVRFDRSHLPAYDPTMVAAAWAFDDDAAPFGFEYVRACTFREVNFGAEGDGASGQQIAGSRRSGHGFTICGSCGRVQDRGRLRRHQSDGKRTGLHLPRCRQARSEDDKTYKSVLYIYREFSSEAIRILLPLAASRDDTDVKSFVAALDLGLRLHFKGKVDHLRTTLVEAKEQALTRRILYLYDTVPGGTSYLRQLGTSPEDLKSVLESALRHMSQCRCNEDEDKDGCYRCIRSHRASFGAGDISRDAACRKLAELLAVWEKLKPVATISDVKLNRVLESELEQMFLERLRSEAHADGGKLNQISHRGRRAWFLKLAGMEWRVVPQEELHKHPEMRSDFVSRADFVLWPAAAQADVKPVVVYLDGWEWHKSRVAQDLALRQRIARSGKASVWSLTWDDLDQETRRDRFWDPVGDVPTAMIERLPGGAEIVARLRAALGRSPAAQLMAHLRAPRHEERRREAADAALALLLKLFKDHRFDPKRHPEAIEALAGNEAVHLIRRREPKDSRCRVAPSGGAAFVGVNGFHPRALPDAAEWTLVIGVDHERPDEREARRNWNGALRLLNLFQFLPSAYVGCKGGIDLPADWDEPAETAETDVWTDIEAEALPDLLPLIAALKQVGTPVPDSLFEAVDAKGIVLGVLELAWPEQKLGLLAEPGLAPAFAAAGWTIFMADEADPASIIDLLLGKAA